MANRKSTTKTKKAQLTPIQRFNPPMEGKHIAFDRITKDFALFLDGQYIGHADSYTEGENRLRDVYYEQLTHAQAEAYEAEQEVVEAVAEALEELPRVTVRADMCEDVLDANYYGWVQGIEYIAGTDRKGYVTSIYIPTLLDNPNDAPQIFFLGEEGWFVEDFLAVYDQITALVSDPRVRAACARFERLRAKAA